MKRMLVVSVDRCLGCKSCELACAVAHSDAQNLYEAIGEQPVPKSRVMVDYGAGFVVPVQCRQCQDAPCMAVCPTEALSRADSDSPVIVEDDLCTGCSRCVLACPFGAIWLDRGRRVVVKCDQCYERLEAGELPACVVACPSHAIELKSVEDAAAAIECYPEAYRVYVLERQCAAKARRALITYQITPERCTGCLLCAVVCPEKAISGERNKPHVIDQSLCIKCGLCADACKYGAVELGSLVVL